MKVVKEKTPASALTDRPTLTYTLSSRPEYDSGPATPVTLTAEGLPSPQDAVFEDCLVQVGDATIKAVVQLGGDDHTILSVYFQPPIPEGIDAVGAAKGVYAALLADPAKLDSFRTEVRGEGDTERPISVWTDGNEHVHVDIENVRHRLHRVEAESLAVLLNGVLNLRLGEAK